MPNHHPCLADLLPAGSEVGEVGEVAALLLAVPTGDLRLHLNRPHPVLLGDTDRSILSQHSTTEPEVPSHPHRQYLFLFRSATGFQTILSVVNKAKTNYYLYGFLGQIATLRSIKITL